MSDKAAADRRAALERAKQVCVCVHVNIHVYTYIHTPIYIYISCEGGLILRRWSVLDRCVAGVCCGSFCRSVLWECVAAVCCSSALECAKQVCGESVLKECISVLDECGEGVCCVLWGGRSLLQKFVAGACCRRVLL